MYTTSGLESVCIDVNKLRWVKQATTWVELDEGQWLSSRLSLDVRTGIRRYADLTMSNANSWKGTPKFFSLVLICVVSLVGSPEIIFGTRS